MCNENKNSSSSTVSNKFLKFARSILDKSGSDELCCRHANSAYGPKLQTIFKILFHSDSLFKDLYEHYRQWFYTTTKG